LTQDFVLAALLREANATGLGTSHAARVRALELLGKHLSMNLTDRQAMHQTIDPKSPPSAPQSDLQVLDIDALSPSTKAAILADLRRAEELKEQQTTPALPAPGAGATVTNGYSAASTDGYEASRNACAG
jgi:hypothetical protein